MPKFCLLLLLTTLLLTTQQTAAQLTNFQNTITKCYNGPTQSYGSTLGTAVGSINFASGTDIPIGHQVVEVVVEIVWSKTDDGSCTTTTGLAPDLSQVGFFLKSPASGSRTIAASAVTGNFSAPVTTSSFVGNNNVIQDTIVFRQGFPSLLPAGIPNTARDTFGTNGTPLSFYTGQSPYGNWSVGAIDDAPLAGPLLCIHSYCITLVTCDFTSLAANCQSNATVALDQSGTHVFSFADLDSASDVSCQVQDITFSPSSVNCSNIGAPTTVTMSITDKLGNTESCVSTVNTVDLSPPLLQDCSPSRWGDRYLGADGRDTFFANFVGASDNCSGVTKEIRSLFGSTWSDKITVNCITNFQQYWFRATDAYGNVDSCRIIVRFLDTIAPTAVCGSHTAYLTNAINGAVTVPAINLDAGSFDVCPPIIGRWIGSQFAPPPTYTCADVGTDTVRLIVADISGNLDTCENAVITIVDTISPVAICKKDTLYLDAAGLVTAFASNINDGSFDVCNIDSLRINNQVSISYDCSHTANPQAVTLTVYDSNGNLDSCQSTLLIRDTIPPSARCRNRTAYLDNNGLTTIIADSINDNSIDICTQDQLTFLVNGSPSISYDCSNLANNAVSLTVIDSFGNTNTCTATITVLDTINPVAQCASPNVYLNNTGTATLFAQQLSTGSSDNCSVVDSFVNTIGVRFINFNCSDLGTPIATQLIVEDQSGNFDSCTTVVNVLDTIAPEALCRASVTLQLDATGRATLAAIAADSNSTDNCSITNYLINGKTTENYNCNNLGSQIVYLTVSDASGNQDSCLMGVVIEDNIPPTITCRNINSYLNSSGNSSITPFLLIDTVNTNDNCSSVTASFADGSTRIHYDCDSIGNNSVQVLVTDNDGNTASCVTNVLVIDTIAPIANCRTNPLRVQLGSNSQVTVFPSSIDNGSFDICQLSNRLINGADSLVLNCANLGNNTVTLLVEDNSGSQNTCSATIIVEDNTAPVAVCSDTTLYLNSSGSVQLAAQQIDGGSFDNCSNVNFSINGQSFVNFNCSQLGVNPVPLTVTDGFGLSSQCVANVTVLDTLIPIANCVPNNSITVFLDSNCFASLPAARFNLNSLDNCSGSISYWINGAANATFNATNITTNSRNVVLTVRDLSGNFDTCSTIVQVYDTMAPVALCQPDTLYLTSSTVTLFPNSINNNSVDNCSSPVLTLNGQASLSFDCNQLGSNPVTLLATDLDGNQDSCTTTVTIIDIAPPVAACRLSVNAYLDPISNLAILNPITADNNSTDNCGIFDYILLQDSFDCSYVNQNTTITLIVSDPSGNLDSCSTTLVVLDTIAPMARCIAADTLYFSGAAINITAATIDAGSSDNCSLASYSIDQSSFDCPDIGINTVTLTVRDSSGNTSFCTSLISLVDSSVTADAGTDQLLCTSDSTILVGNSPTGSLTGQWTSNSSATIQNPASATTAITNLPDGRHVFYWSLSSPSCSNLSTDSVIIEVLSPSSDIANAGFDQFLCEANTITLAGNSPMISTAQWTQPTNQANSGITIANPTDSSSAVNGLTPGVYTFFWEFTNGVCGVHDIDTIKITIDAIPNNRAYAGADISCSPDTIALNATAPTTGVGRWYSLDSNTIIYNPTNPFSLASNFVNDTTRLVWALSYNTCTDYLTDTMSVLLNAVSPLAVADTFLLNTSGAQQAIDVTANDILTVNWQIIVLERLGQGDLTNLSNGSFDVDISGVKTTQYFTYQVCNSNCPVICDTAEVVLYIEETENCYIPNAFTPNGDGSNDRFIIPCLDNVQQKAALSVFNRWGNLVYQTDNYLSDWEGTHRDQPLPNGTYFYILKITDKQPQKGSIEIRR